MNRIERRKARERPTRVLASDPRRTTRVVLSALAFVLFVFVGPSSAEAVAIHDLRYQVPATEVPGGSYFSTGVAVDNDPSSPSSGEVYVASDNPLGIDKFTPGPSSASYLCQITGLGSIAGHSATECDTSTAGPGGFEGLRGVAVDPSSGDIYAADVTAHRVFQFSPSGAYTGKQLDLGSATAQRLAVSTGSGAVFIADETNQQIVEWNPAAEDTAVFATEAGSPPSGFARVCGVATDGDPASPNYGDVYVADCGKSVVDRFSEAGAYQCEITGGGEGSVAADECDISEPGVAVEPNFDSGRLHDLHGALTVDPRNGHLYIGEGSDSGFGFGRLDEFSPAGAFLATITQPDSQDNTAYVPWSLAVSASTGYLFVASIGNNDEVFAYGPDKALPATGSAANVTPSSATLTGTVNPLGSEVSECVFEYVAEADYHPADPEPYGAGATAPCLTESDSSAVGNGESAVAVHADLSGLGAGDVYHYRLKAVDANGTSVGSDRFFGPPTVSSEGVAEIDQTSARLTGFVNPNNIEASYRFEYGEPGGPAGSYQHSVPAPDAVVGDGAADVLVAQQLGGLEVGATYHYRLVASSSDGTATGKDRTFSTLPAALIDAQPAASIGANRATLHAYLDPLGSATTYRFEWGSTSSYGHATPAVSAGGGEDPTLAEASLEGLQPASEYHFRLIAEGVKGTVDGPDEAFTTEAATCPNEQLRAENDSTALSECRAYEQVTPAAKNGAAVDKDVAFLAAPDGNRAWFYALGFFAGNSGTGYEYLAQRSPTGWHTSSANPSWTYALRTAPLYSPDLTESLMNVELAEAFSPAASPRALFLNEGGTVRQASPSFEPLGGFRNEEGESHIELIGASENLQTAILHTPYALLPEDHLPESGAHHGPPFVERLYEVVGVGGPSPSLRLLNIGPDGSQLQTCTQVSLNLGGPGATGASYSVDRSGNVVFFNIDATTTGGGCSFDNQLYARLGGATTVPISEPEPNDECTTSSCRGAAVSGAAFAGASADGSRAYFLSSRQLTDEASEGSAPAAANECGRASGPSGCNLYLYDFNRPSGHNLLAVSAGDSTGEAPAVQGVAALAGDGSRAYFVAQGRLTSVPNSLGQRAQVGADNLFVYNADAGTLAFVAELCSGEERSGTLSGVARCFGDDSEAIWHGSRPQISTTPDGSVLDFVSHAQLTPDDENEVTDVYRYDARTGALARVSVGHGGFDQNGNAGGHDAHLVGADPEDGYEKPELLASLDSRSMSDDGSTIVFSTARPLQEGDEKGHVDAYVWHQGQVSQISAGKSTTDLPADVLTTSSGRDVFFLSDESLVPGDRDGVADVYDARVGGGFALPPPPPPICESDETCHGPSTEPPAAPSITHLAGTPNAVNCHRGFVQHHERCIRKHRHRRHHHPEHRHRRRPPAHPHRGASK